MTQHFERATERPVRDHEPAAGIGSREIPLLVQPEVALHGTRGATSRRQALRGAGRFLSVAAGDVVAAAFAATVVRVLVSVVSRWAGPVQLPYASATEFCASVLLALMLTGNYRRSNTGHPTSNLLLGSALGVVMVSWSSLWTDRSLATIPIAASLACATACALFLSRNAIAALSSSLLPEERRLSPAILILGQSGTPATLSASSGYRVADTLHIDRDHIDHRSRDLARLIRRSRAEALVVMGGIRSSSFTRVLEIGLRAGCEVLCVPPGYEIAGVRASITRRGPYDLVQVGPASLMGTQFLAKRLVDVVGAVLALVCAVPITIAIAIAIRLDSPGPVFFRQWRIGIGGRRFRMFKFRTMRVGADEEKARLAELNVCGDPQLFKIRDDPRVTPVGRFLREWSLDELPQFLNVLLGDMSLVGPRPLPESDVVGYEEHHFRRLGAKPGISGLWQVSGRSDVVSFEEMVRLDTEYIDHWSLWLDFRILLLTLPAVLRRTGAC